jgi:hypothetical protein
MRNLIEEQKQQRARNETLLKASRQGELGAARDPGPREKGPAPSNSRSAEGIIWKPNCQAAEYIKGWEWPKKDARVQMQGCLTYEPVAVGY